MDKPRIKQTKKTQMTEDCSQQSPALLSPRANEFSRSLEDYDNAANGAAKRCDMLFEADRETKELQSCFFDMLAAGDTCWENLEKAHSTNKQAQIEALQECITKMRENLAKQESNIDSLEKAAQKAVRALDSYARAIAGLREHVIDVGESLNERVACMEQIEPDLKPKKKKSHSSGKHSKEMMQNSKDPDEKKKKIINDEVKKDKKEELSMDALERAAMRGAERALALHNQSKAQQHTSQDKVHRRTALPPSRSG